MKIHVSEEEMEEARRRGREEGRKMAMMMKRLRQASKEVLRKDIAELGIPEDVARGMSNVTMTVIAGGAAYEYTDNLYDDEIIED